jgi:hypothetical protein
MAIAGASTAASTLSAGAATVGHATMEKTHASLEAINQNRAVSESIDEHTRHQAAKSALEHHIAAKEHAIAKQENAQASGITSVQQTAANAIGTVQGAARTSVDTVSSVARTSIDSVTGASSAVAHAALEKKHALQADYFKAEATSELVTPHERKEAAKSALEHHAEAKEHNFQKVVAAENSGLNATSQVVGGYVSYAGEVLAQGARSIGNTAVWAVQGIPTAVNTLWATGGAAAHKGAETTNSLQAEYYREQATDDRVTASERMDAAKAALEHEASAKSHAIAKEQAKEEAGINTAVAKTNELLQSGKVKVAEGVQVSKEKISETVQAGKEKLLGAQVAPATTTSNMS